MARPRYNAHPDANQAEDVEELRRQGFLVKVVSQWFDVGDLLVWGYDINRLENRLTWWEWKTLEGELTDTQKEFMAANPGLVHEGRRPEDVLIEYGRLHGCAEGD